MADLFSTAIDETVTAGWSIPLGAVRRLEDMGDGTNAEVTLARPTAEARVLSGQLFLAGTGNLTLSVAGNVRMVLQNPAGSGKSLYIVKLDAFATAVGFAELLVNPTAGVPTAARPVNNAMFGALTAAVGLLFADTSAATALSGGVDSGVSVGVGNNNLTSYPLPPLVVPPGVSLGLALPFTGSANATVNLFWYEV